jgi:hypothetical protein
MTIRTNLLIEMLALFPADSTVRGFEYGLAVKNPDGTGEVLLLNDTICVRGMTDTRTSELTLSSTTMLEPRGRTHAHTLRIVARKPA